MTDYETDPNYRAFVDKMSEGECLCDEIAEKDRPCLTCEANYVESWWWKPPQPEPPPKEDRVHVTRGGKGEVARLRERRTK